MTLLPQGVPSMADYERLVASPELSELTSFSAAFRARHADLVRRDPLEQWSRRWEYPFAFEAVGKHVEERGGGSYRVLDAGSGFTFFPFLLSERLPVSVTCVDASPALEPAFRRAVGEAEGVEFRRGDVAGHDVDLGPPFDGVLCISVLEHVDARDRDRVLGELRRLLRPGGLLVVTFDVAIDGDYEIPLRDAETLLETVSRTFPHVDVSPPGSLAEAVRGDVLTSRRVAEREPWRMPWSGRVAATLGSLRHGFVPRSFGYRNLTVWCGRIRREDQPAVPGSA